jgi:hypothetical protein
MIPAAVQAMVQAVHARVLRELHLHHALFGYGLNDADLIETLLDFARAGDAASFRELARMRGVPAADIDAMWAGTMRRVGMGMNQ